MRFLTSLIAVIIFVIIVSDSDSKSRNPKVKKISKKFSKVESPKKYPEQIDWSDIPWGQ